MTQKYDIDYLFAGKVAGSLNNDELLEIGMLISQDEAIRLRWNEFIASLPENNELVPPKDWLDLTTMFQQSDKGCMHRTLLKKMVLVSILAVICITVYLYSPKKTTTNTIKLQLANGQVIDLNKVEDINTQLNNTNNTLSYKDGSTGMNSLTTPVGIDYKIRLNDGTEIWLNALTQLDFPFAFIGNTREITINGEAYLKIAKDENRPFIIHLPHNDIKVLGTEFNVNSYDSGIVKVSLVEGALNLLQGEKTISVKPGMEVIADGKITLHNFDERQVLGWRKGMYYFYDADLKEISKVLPRWFGITVVIDTPTIINRKFAGVVDKNQPIEVFIDNLKTVANIDCFYDKPQNTLHFK
ncbi:DUF4974 domain-containing protein [Chitinophaga oryziterrae]|uniref:DUF4974 domain-containing protein n=1 Tax=Chitinophaga oryziterrae TaxID=1031224 RepID=A0A6N8JKG1_9BACT|nr:FecR family protein [Chitinophaga oryziterrae]MVT44728.1 DUF4974 domain-containing protein [Chitinophaga oryziterrae]